MSRLGKRPLTVPKGVTAKLADGGISVKGSKGELKRPVHELVNLELKGDQLSVNRKNDSQQARALQGLFVRLIQNMFKGVSEGFEKGMEIVGVGYKAELKGKELHFTIGFSNPQIYKIPQGVDIVMEKPTIFKVKGIDKELVGQVAADIRSIREPDHYKGKGIRYAGEYIKLKPGKASVSAGF